MRVNENGHRYVSYRKWERTLHRPYDYANKGLMKRLVSNRLANTRNPITRYMMDIEEYSIIFVLKYIDILNNFFNYNWRNR
ncbi:MAG: hypothetical protein IIZ78_03405 [Clostridiales bacterium]|nr:hypothetical protein [Clostridiales bacterium]